MMGRKILVADDEPHVLETVKAYLTEDGFQGLTVKNGRDALFAFRHEKPALVILGADSSNVFQAAEEARRAKER